MKLTLLTLLLVLFSGQLPAQTATPDSLQPKKDSFEVMPAPGYDYNEWLSKNIMMPVVARENCIQGRVLVKFIVDTTGKIDSVHVARGVHKSLDDEALRVVRTFPAWKPGMRDGKPIKVYFTIPIMFSLEAPGCLSADQYFDRAVKLYGKGKIAEALDNFKAAARINDGDVEALYNIAAIYISQDKFNDACPYLKQILEVRNGSNPEGRDVKGFVTKYCSQ